MNAFFRTLLVVGALCLDATSFAGEAGRPAGASPQPTLAGVARAPAPAEPGSLRLSAGTIQLGGALSAAIHVPGGWGGWSLAVTPEFGYFVADGLAIVADLGVVMPSSGGYSHWMIDFGLGAKVHFDAGGFVPYVGLTAGLRVLTSLSHEDHGVWSEEDWYLFDLKVPIGLLLPLNRDVAIDAGVLTRFGIGDGRYEIAPLVQVGVRAFF